MWIWYLSYSMMRVTLLDLKIESHLESRRIGLVIEDFDTARDIRTGRFYVVGKFCRSANVRVWELK